MNRRSPSLVVAAAVLPLALSLGSCRSAAVGLVEGRLGPCPWTPNCVSSEEPSSIAPLAFAGEPAAAFRSLVDFLRAEPRAEIVHVDEAYAHVVFRTPLLRFRDDLELRLDAEAGVVHVRSASRVGFWDLGANRARVEAIRGSWTPPPGADQAANRTTR